MRSLLLRTLGTLAVIGLPACASVQREAGFGDVQRTVATHTGAAASWHLTPSHDSAARRITDSLLALNLTAETAVQIAVLNNRTLQARYEQLGITQTELVQAGLLSNPVIRGGVEFARGISTRGISIGIAQGFVDLFQRPARKRVASYALEQEKLDAANTVFDLAVQTRAAFYDAQAAEQARELRQSVVEAARLASDVAGRLHAAGNITDLDLATEQSFYEETQLDLLDADASVADTRQALATLMGVTVLPDSLRIARRLPLPFTTTEPADTLVQTALGGRLDLALARQMIVTSGQQAGLARTQALIPDLELEAEWERTPGGERSITPGIAVRIPLFDQGQAISAGNRARIRAAQEQYAALGMTVSSEVRRAWLRTELLRQRAERLLNVVIPLRTKVVDETQREYNGMLVGIFTLLATKREQIEAGHAYVEALHAYWIARTELERAVGMRLSGSAELSRDPLAPAPAAQPGAQHDHQHHH